MKKKSKYYLEIFLTNSTQYKGNHVTWAKGRRMASYGKMKYRYNPSGSRIGKSDGDTKTAYYLDGTRLIREETISDSNRPYVPGALESIDYHYDGPGQSLTKAKDEKSR